MSRSARLATIYALAFVAFAVSAGFVYPIFHTKSFVGFDSPAPTVLVFQKGSLGTTPTSAQVRIDSINGRAYLDVHQENVADLSEVGAEVVVAIESWTGEGFSYDLDAPTCRALADDGEEVKTSTVEASSLDPLYRRGIREGTLGGVPELSGSATSVVFANPSAAIKIDCDLPSFRFVQESLANRNVYVPGIEAFGVGGAEKPVRSYSIAREGADFIVQVSQAPSETLAAQYVWYEREFENLARDGLFLTVSNPSLQEESSMRLFGAGGLLGLAGGFLVAAVQQLFEPRPTRAKP